MCKKNFKNSKRVTEKRTEKIEVFLRPLKYYIMNISKNLQFITKSPQKNLHFPAKSPRKNLQFATKSPRKNLHNEINSIENESYNILQKRWYKCR